MRTDHMLDSIVWLFFQVSKDQVISEIHLSFSLFFFSLRVLKIKLFLRQFGQGNAGCKPQVGKGVRPQIGRFPFQPAPCTRHVFESLENVLFMARVEGWEQILRHLKADQHLSLSECEKIGESTSCQPETVLTEEGARQSLLDPQSLNPKFFKCNLIPKRVLAQILAGLPGPPMEGLSGPAKNE